VPTLPPFLQQVVKKLAKFGVKMIAMRCAGFDRVDLAACADYGIKVARVPTYSPTSVAEHAVSLLMALNRCGFGLARGVCFGRGVVGCVGPETS
jgi:lactate dehydrogenase-like 2-hydroxyacid dehydrogenase